MLRYERGFFACAMKIFCAPYPSWVSAVALANAAFAALSVLWIGREPLTERRRFAIQALGALPGFLGQIRFNRLAIILAVARQPLLCGCFEFVGLMSKVSSRTTFGFRGVAGQFNAINGEHFSANQALAIAEIKPLGKALGDFFIKAGNKGREGGEVRCGIARKRNESNGSRHNRSMPRLLTTPWA